MCFHSMFPRTGRKVETWSWRICSSGVVGVIMSLLMGICVVIWGLVREGWVFHVPRFSVETEDLGRRPCCYRVRQIYPWGYKFSVFFTTWGNGRRHPGEGFGFECQLGCQWGYHRVWIVSSPITFVDSPHVDLIFISRYLSFSWFIINNLWHLVVSLGHGDSW